MKEKVKQPSKAKNKGSSQDDTARSSSKADDETNEIKNNRASKGQKLIVDRVRRGYPDGPGGSYEGF